MCHPPTHVRAGRYRTRTAAEPTATTTSAASGGSSEELLGPRPAIRKQGAADAGCRNPSACGGNREARLGPRSDFSKPCQGAAEKSANATRCCCLARGFQSSGMSTKKAPPAEAPFAEPRFVQYRTGTMYVRTIRKKQRQGIIVAMVSCLLCYMTRLGAIAARRLSSRIWYCSFFWEYGILGSINRIYKGESR